MVVTEGGKAAQGTPLLQTLTVWFVTRPNRSTGVSVTVQTVAAPASV
jgi:hypothetical protein